MNLITSFTRLSLHLAAPQQIALSRTITTNSVLNFKQTACLFAEPLKKKKKMDPSILKAREERRKKKLEKQIRKLEKNSKQYKPIDECQVPVSIADNKELYQRTAVEIAPEVIEQRILLGKQWAKYKRDESLVDTQMLDRIAYSQQRALDELRAESEELYQEAVQPDVMLLPLKSEGPNNTPPIAGYDAPDGDYVDVSKKW